MIIQILLYFLFLYIIPLVIGYAFNQKLHLDQTYSASYFLGWILIWAIMQCVCVPLILLRVTYSSLILFLSAIISCLFIFAIITTRKSLFVKIKLPSFRSMSRSEKLAFLELHILFLVILGATIFLQHSDWDDSRFVVNAVDMIRTNRLYLTDPTTGLALERFSGEVIKDVTAPWAVFLAFGATLTRMSPTVFAHTFLPPILLLICACVYRCIGRFLFPGNEENVNRFCAVIWFVCMFGYASIYTTEVFQLTRIWQGKADVAAFGIPALYWLLHRLYNEEHRISNYILIMILNLAMCFMSGMGLILSAMILGCFGLVYGIVKRNPKLSLILWSFCIPNAIYYLMHIIL